MKIFEFCVIMFLKDVNKCKNITYNKYNYVRIYYANLLGKPFDSYKIKDNIYIYANYSVNLSKGVECI